MARLRGRLPRGRPPVANYIALHSPARDFRWYTCISTVCSQCPALRPTRVATIPGAHHFTLYSTISGDQRWPAYLYRASVFGPHKNTMITATIAVIVPATAGSQ